MILCERLYFSLLPRTRYAHQHDSHHLALTNTSELRCIERPYNRIKFKWVGENRKLDENHKLDKKHKLDENHEGKNLKKKHETRT